MFRVGNRCLVSSIGGDKEERCGGFTDGSMWSAYWAPIKVEETWACHIE
jgi:hypothetical protein